MRRHVMACCASLLGLTLASWGAGVAPVTAPATQPAVSGERSRDRAAPSFEASIDVQIDPAAATDNGLEPSAIKDRVRQYLRSHDSFTLTDLQNVKIPNPDGRDVLLQEVASVQVKFRRHGK